MIIINHEFFKQINTKIEQLIKIVRFLNNIEHYGIRIIYKPGKANMLADYLSRSFEAAHSATKFNEKKGPMAIIKPLQPEQLNRLNLQAICEHLLKVMPLSPNLDASWVCKHFIMHDSKLHKIATYNKAYGNPPHFAGMAATATVLLPVPEHWDLHQHAKSTYLQHGHATVGAIQRLLAIKFWHPESTLAVQQMLAKCPSCQLIKPPDPALPNLVSIIPPPPLTQWAIDYTF
jgi:hypothetical protein